jgi:hypothetical protein
LQLAVERKYERDIDILLAEEFTVSREFATWFWRHTRFAETDAKVSDVFVSRSDSTGESDLIVLYESLQGSRRFALMIEDKIDAPLQPEQVARYRIRGQASISDGAIDDFEVILCSPESYQAALIQTASFDAFVSYEAISKFLKEHDATKRGVYRANFIAKAASRSANRWVRINDETTNAFWKSAYEFAARRFPILEMKKASFAKDSTWINFRPHDLPTLPRRIYISLKGDRGFIDLTFTGSVAHLFFEETRPILEADMTVHQTGKSAAIRIGVEGFKSSESWESAAPRVENAFLASERLIKFFRSNRILLEQAASKSVPTLPISGA